VSVDVDRLICGFAAVYGEDARDLRGPHAADEFRALLPVDESNGLRLWVDHAPVFLSRGGVRPGVGLVLRFAEVDGRPYTPHGLLMLAAVDQDELGDSVLQVVRDGQFTAFSLGGNGRPEVSLTDRPAYENARVVGIGQDAADAWELLTGTSVLDELAVAS
jgi:hypothetical protein